MKDIKIEKCPFCGGEKMIETRLDSYGGVYVFPAQKRGLFRSAVLYAIVCRNCGSVVRLFCKNPEKLFPKKERRE